MSECALAVEHPALRYHGGKFRLAKWLMGFFPAHTCYVECYGGAAGVLVQKDRCYAEVYNDLDGDIVNFFRVLQDPIKRQKLIDQLWMTPFSRLEFELAFEATENDIEQARRTCIRAAQGFGSAGATKGRTGFRTDTRRKYGTAQHLWAKYPDTIAAVGERFSGVLIECKNAVEVMLQHDSDSTLHYVDPPYVLSTRMRAAVNRYYRHELNDQQHHDLIGALRNLKGMVVLSGYKSDIYAEALSDWTQHSCLSRIASNRGTALRSEVVWLNPACALALSAIK